MEQRRAASCTALAASGDNAATGWDSCSSAASLALLVSATLRASTHLPCCISSPGSLYMLTVPAGLLRLLYQLSSCCLGTGSCRC